MVTVKLEWLQNILVMVLPGPVPASLPEKFRPEKRAELQTVKQTGPGEIVGPGIFGLGHYLFAFCRPGAGPC